MPEELIVQIAEVFTQKYFTVALLGASEDNETLNLLIADLLNQIPVLGREELMKTLIKGQILSKSSSYTFN